MKTDLQTYPLYVDGGWRAGSTSRAVINPATGEPFARITVTDRAGVAEALRAADGAFDGWRRQTAKARGDLLLRVARAVEARRDEIARAITLENGKPLAQSTGEVSFSIEHLRWFAEEARRSYGRVIPHEAEGKRHLVVKTPVGPVAAIAPWNFPLVLGVRKVAPALAAGCPVILKPASQTPVSSVLFAECMAAAEVPRGVFQLVLAPAAEMAAELLESPLCRKITFTGSTEVGRSLIAGAARLVKPLSLELGGQAPLLVFADADLDAAVERAVAAKFRNGGQSCIAANRLYIERSIYGRFLEAFTARTQALKVDDGMAPGVDIGPLIDAEAVSRAQAHVEDAQRRGARLLVGGQPLSRAGYYFAPTVLANVPDDALCMQEETFAPIAPVAVFDTEEEAIARANRSPFGLAAYAFTRDLGRAFRLAEGLEAGTIGINDGVPATSACPFGGLKQSGWGRELGAEGLDAFLDTKHVSLGIG